MRKAVALAVVLSYSSPLTAQPVQDIPPGEDKIVPIKMGQLAPFDGQLYEPATALRWANWIHQYQFRLKTEAELAQATLKTEIDYRDKLLVISETAHKQVQDDLLKRLAAEEAARLKAEEAAANPPWYSSFWFGMVVTTVGLGTIFGLSAYAIGQVKANP